MTGTALGADTDSTQWGVLIAILAHKGLAGFALCCSLLKADTKKCSLLATLISFVLATPSGVVLGMAISTILDGSENFTGKHQTQQRSFESVISMLSQALSSRLRQELSYSFPPWS